MRPTGWQFVILPYPKVVLPRGVNVQFCPNAGTVQGQIHDNAVGNFGFAVIAGMGEKDRWGIRRYVNALPNLIAVVGLQVVGIAQHGKVCPAAGGIQRVNFGVVRIGEACGSGQCKMTPGRETYHADAVRINAPFGGLITNQPDGALSVQ